MKPEIYFKNKIKRWRKKVKQEKVNRRRNRSYTVKGGRIRGRRKVKSV